MNTPIVLRMVCLALVITACNSSGGQGSGDVLHEDVSAPEVRQQDASVEAEIAFGPCEGPGYTEQHCRVVTSNDNDEGAEYIYEDRHFYAEGLLTTVEGWRIEPEEKLLRTTLYEYNKAGQLMKQTLQDSAWDSEIMTEYAYDGQGRLLEESSYSSNEVWMSTVAWEYGNGWIRMVTTYPEGSPYLHDEAITYYLDADGEVTHIEFDEDDDGTIDSTCVNSWSDGGNLLTTSRDPMWYGSTAEMISQYEDGLLISMEVFYEDGTLLVSSMWTYDACRRQSQMDFTATYTVTEAYYYDCDW